MLKKELEETIAALEKKLRLTEDALEHIRRTSGKQADDKFNELSEKHTHAMRALKDARNCIKIINVALSTFDDGY